MYAVSAVYAHMTIVFGLYYLILDVVHSISLFNILLSLFLTCSTNEFVIYYKYLQSKDYCFQWHL